MPPRGRERLRSPRSASLFVATALVVAGCAGSVSADQANVLAATAAEGAATAEPEPLLDGPAPDASAEAAPGQSDDLLLKSSPDGSSVVGSLATDFPTDLLPLPDDATLLVTSAVPVGDGTVQEISLNLRTAWSTDRVLGLLGTSLLDAGFTAVPAVDTGLSGEATYTRSDGDELVSIGVLDDDGVRTVTVGGRVHTAG